MYQTRDCTNGGTVVSPAWPCAEQPIHSVPVPATLWLLVVGVAVIARLKR
jgi:hypothetical protein